MEKYRTPDISEFVQGFEYEMAHDYESGIIDLTGTNKYPKLHKSRIWKQCKVWWKEPDNNIITTIDEDGNTFIRKAHLDNWFAPTNIEYLIKEKLVRVKNINYEKWWLTLMANEKIILMTAVGYNNVLSNPINRYFNLMYKIKHILNDVSVYDRVNDKIIYNYEK